MSFVSIDQGFLRIKLPSISLFHLLIKCCIAFCLCVHIPIQTLVFVGLCCYFVMQYLDSKETKTSFESKEDMMNYVRSQIA